MCGLSTVLGCTVGAVGLLPGSDYLTLQTEQRRGGKRYIKSVKSDVRIEK